MFLYRHRLWPNERCARGVEWEKKELKEIKRPFCIVERIVVVLNEFEETNEPYFTRHQIRSSKAIGSAFIDDRPLIKRKFAMNESLLVQWTMTPRLKTYLSFYRTRNTSCIQDDHRVNTEVEVSEQNASWKLSCFLSIGSILNSRDPTVSRCQQMRWILLFIALPRPAGSLTQGSKIALSLGVRWEGWRESRGVRVGRHLLALDAVTAFYIIPTKTVNHLDERQGNFDTLRGWVCFQIHWRWEIQRIQHLIGW